jgi:class 3 adenylate cyclase
LLARGKPAAAFASIRRALADDLPALARARLLPALVEIAIAADEVESAAAGAEELQATSARYDTPALYAAAGVATAAVAMARGEADAAVSPLRRALRLWQQTNARYEAARTRILLAQAYRVSGDEDGAMRELARAGSVFDQLGARRDSQAVDGLLGRAGRRVTSTFVFTDIVDSTRLLEERGDEAWQSILQRHDTIVRKAAVSSDGTVVEHTGDGFFLAFPGAEAAVSAAIAIQRELARTLEEVRVRIGVHTAEATSVGGNYRGKGVHVAARIGALGEEIVASRETVAALTGIPTRDARAAQLKGITEPIEVVSIDWRDDGSA